MSEGVITKTKLSFITTNTPEDFSEQDSIFFFIKLFRYSAILITKITLLLVMQLWQSSGI